MNHLRSRTPSGATYSEIPISVEVPGEALTNRSVTCPGPPRRAKSIMAAGDAALCRLFPMVDAPKAALRFGLNPIKTTIGKENYYFQQMLEGLGPHEAIRWRSPNPPMSLRWQFLRKRNFDVDQMLTYLAVLNWMGPWDDSNPETTSFGNRRTGNFV